MSPTPVSPDVTKRNESIAQPIPIPNEALKQVKNGEDQCFQCGQFGHALRGCPDRQAGRPRTAAHWNDWRKVAGSEKMYSLSVLWPRGKSSKPRQTTPQSSTKKVFAAAATWSAEGTPDGEEEIDAEYLCDGGTTTSVSNRLASLTHYTSFQTPIPLETAAHGSDAVLLGKGCLTLPTNKGGSFLLRDVYYCPKARETLISQGAFIQQGSTSKFLSNHDIVVQLPNSHTISARYKGNRWFIPRSDICIQPSKHVACAAKSVSPSESALF